MLITAIYIN